MERNELGRSYQATLLLTVGHQEMIHIGYLNH